MRNSKGNCFLGEGLRGVAASLLLLAPLASPAAPTPPPETESSSASDDASYLETPAFPGVRYRDAIRLNYEARIVPDANIGDGHGTLVRPDLQARVTLPLSDRTVVRLSARGGMSSYQFRGAPVLVDAVGNDLVGNSLDAYRAEIAAQGAVRLNPDGASWLSEGEQWALLGTLGAGSRWEEGAFVEGLRVGTGVAVGYEIEDRLRVALGANVDVHPETGKLDVGPLASLRWNLSEAVTLRNRGLGAQLEYAYSPKLELFVNGMRKTDRYRLASVAGVGNDLSFRDRQVMAGGGFEWKASRHLRINAEAGVLAWRKLKVSDDDRGTLSSQSAEPSAYLSVRFEVRP